MSEVCHHCKGRRILNDGTGEYSCPECSGSGYYPDCPKCGGNRVVYISSDSSAYGAKTRTSSSRFSVVEVKKSTESLAA